MQWNKERIELNRKKRGRKQNKAIQWFNKDFHIKSTWQFYYLMDKFEDKKLFHLKRRKK